MLIDLFEETTGNSNPGSVGTGRKHLLDLYSKPSCKESVNVSLHDAL